VDSNGDGDQRRLALWGLVFLATGSLSALAGIVWIYSEGREPPEILKYLVTFGFGAIAGQLPPANGRSNGYGPRDSIGATQAPLTTQATATPTQQCQLDCFAGQTLRADR
jgi:hypothetical protein